MSPTDEQKHRAVGDIVYEMWMLRTMEAALRLEPRERWLRCAVLESFLIHYRNLRNFFISGGQERADDIFAQHFMADLSCWQTIRERFEPPPEEGGRVNKALAHLSYKRPKLNLDSGWDTAKMRTRMENLWQAFVENATPYFRARFQEELYELERT